MSALNSEYVPCSCGAQHSVDSGLRFLDPQCSARLVTPINWDDMGSSAKDLWEERQLRSIRKVALRR